MSALIVGNIAITDPSELAAYTELAGPSMKEFGLRLVAKGAPTEMLEGSLGGMITVILEAESAEKAREWYSSESYTRAIEARPGGATFSIAVLPCE